MLPCTVQLVSQTHCTPLRGLCVECCYRGPHQGLIIKTTQTTAYASLLLYLSAHMAAPLIFTSSDLLLFHDVDLILFTVFYCCLPLLAPQLPTRTTMEIQANLGLHCAYSAYLITG